MMIRLSRVLALPLLAACMVLLQAPARAQDLPSEITAASVDLSDGQKAQMEQYIARYAEAISGTGGTTASIRDGFAGLSRPVSSPASSQYFRKAFGQSLAQRLETLVKNAQAPIAARVNAAMLAGAIASDSSVPVITAALASDAAAVRYAGADAVRKAFEMQALGGKHADLGPAFLGVVENVENRMGTEKDDAVLGAMLSACGANPNAGLAIQSVMRGIQSHVRTTYPKGPTTGAARLQASLQTSVSRYIQEVAGNGSDKVETQKAVVQTAVMVIRSAVKFGKEGTLKGSLLSDYQGLVATAENALCVVTEGSQTVVGDNFSAGKFADAESALRSLWLSASGPICSHPAWGFTPTSFDKLLGE